MICITLSGCTVNLEQQVTDNNSKGTKMIWISDEVIDNISATNRIIVKNAIKEKVKTITDTKKIEKIINLISSGEIIDGDITYEGPIYYLEMNYDDQLIEIINVFDESIGLNNDQNNRYKIKINELKGLIKK